MKSCWDTFSVDINVNKNLNIELIAIIFEESAIGRLKRYFNKKMLTHCSQHLFYLL